MSAQAHAPDGPAQGGKDMASEADLVKAKTFFKYVRLEFRMSYYPDGVGQKGEEFDLWFSATTEAADKLAQAMSRMMRDTLVSVEPGKKAPVVAMSLGPDYELVGEGEFRGWTVEEIAESFAQQEQQERSFES
jgi:hypothetical protein